VELRFLEWSSPKQPLDVVSDIFDETNYESTILPSRTCSLLHTLPLPRTRRRPPLLLPDAPPLLLGFQIMVAPLRTPSPPSSRPSLSLLPSATASALHLGVGQQDLRFFPAPLPPLRPLNPAAPASAPQPTAPSAAGQQPPQPPEVVWWGTLQMCSPAAPRAHPDNQEAGPTQQQQRGKGESPWNTSSTSSTLEPQGRGPHIQHLVQS
jgi:hypothetical protein